MLATQLEMNKEIESLRKKFEDVNRQLYEKTWQLNYAHKMLTRIMERDEIDEFSLKLLLNELNEFVD